MPLILSKRARTRQPQSPVRIDRSNPITNGLCICWSSGDIAPNQGAGSLSREPRKNAIATVSSGAVTPYVVGRGLPAYPSTLLRYGSTALDTFTGLGPARLSGSDARFFIRMQTGANNSVHIRAISGDNWSWREFSANATTRSSTPSLQVAVVKSQSDIDVYWDGVKDNGALITGSTASASLTFDTLTPFSPSIERARVDSEYSVSGTSVFLSAVWNRCLTEAEVKSISANPWQIFEPKRVYRWIPAAGGEAQSHLASDRLPNP